MNTVKQRRYWAAGCLNECDIYIKSAELSLHKMENIEGIKKYSDVTKEQGK